MLTLVSVASRALISLDSVVSFVKALGTSSDSNSVVIGKVPPELIQRSISQTGESSSQKRKREWAAHSCCDAPSIDVQIFNGPLLVGLRPMSKANPVFLASWILPCPRLMFQVEALSQGQETTGAPA